MVVIDRLHINHEFVGEVFNHILHHLRELCVLLHSQAKDGLHLPPNIDGAHIEIFPYSCESRVLDLGKVNNNFIRGNSSS